MNDEKFAEKSMEYCRLSFEISKLREDKKWVETQYALWAAQTAHMTFIQNEVAKQTSCFERIAKAIEAIANEYGCANNVEFAKDTKENS